MKLAIFHTNTIRGSWTSLVIPKLLEGLGHQVIDAPIPTDPLGRVVNLTKSNFIRYKEQFPLFEELVGCDAILCFAIEYYLPWLKALYGDSWFDLGNRVAFYAESSDRMNYEPFKPFSDQQFYPDAEDAKKYGGKISPPCVDTSMFYHRNEQKSYDVGFLGTLYPKRVEFLQALAPFLGGLTLTCGEVQVHDLSGERHFDWATLNARNISQMKIHLALPGNNMKMASARHFETLACGTFLLSFKVPELTAGKHYIVYDPEDPQECANLIRYYLEKEDERQHIATAGWAYVHSRYSTQTVLPNLIREIKVLTSCSIQR